jgi:transcriptional regulator with XRE-family HTH domain|tara:strand:+ start:185 stop:403 length:219 start_codon:yes stop_codon:yes gene_type:complete
MPKKPLSDQIREAIQNAGVSRYRISKATGITEAALSRFLHGKSGISLDTLDILGEYLGLDITTRKTPKRKGK